jgi:hypothetical protein
LKAGWQEQALLSKQIDFLEQSIIETAPFGAVFPKIIVIFWKCRMLHFDHDIWS